MTVGNVDGRNFMGTYGDGELDVNGGANVSSWPAGATASGAGFRGGNWYSFAVYARASDRFLAANSNAARDFAYGWRAAHRAP